MGLFDRLFDWMFGKPIPVPAPVPSPVEPSAILTLLELHNDYRLANGLPKLIHNPVLDNSAQFWANWMARESKLVHEAKGYTLVSRIRDAGFTPWLTLAENILKGAISSDQAFDIWKKSKPHQLNILGNYRSIGFGVALDTRAVPFWCVNFGSLADSPPLKDFYASFNPEFDQRVTLSGPIFP